MRQKKKNPASDNNHHAVDQGVWGKVAVFLATGAGVGYAPFAPGTFGAVWGLLLALGISYGGVSLVPQVAIILAVAIVGVPICAVAAKQIGKKDPGMVIWDEISSA